MKKFLFFMICCVGAFVLFSHQDELSGRLQWLEKPRVHVVQKGESLSKLAKENYGSVNYWRELALVNRAPKPNHIEPGEQVLLPSADVLRNLRRARTLSRVNDIVNTQTAGLRNSSTTQPSVTTVPPSDESNKINPASTPEATEPQAGSETGGGGVTATDPVPEQTGSNAWFWLILGLIALGGVIGFVFYRRRQEEKEKLEMEKEAAVGERRNFQSDRRSIMQRKQEDLTV
ncbi:MAG: LysM peptidoglycan-binding domain-containing protein [bacterium]